MKDEKWYQARLQRYFNKRYSDYEEEIEWFPNPAINKWKFYIPTFRATITLTCHDTGGVTFRMQMDAKTTTAN